MRTEFEPHIESVPTGLLIDLHETVIKFDSPSRSYIRSLFPEAKQFLAQTGVKYGRMRMYSGHTTMGLILQETDEVKLLDDLVWLSKIIVPSDERGSEFKDGLIDPKIFPTSKEWTHNCEDNPLLPQNERDQDRNPDKHARAQIMTLSEIGMDIRDGELRVGRFKRPAAFELDGGEESELREARRRKIFVTVEEYDRAPKIYPAIELPPYQI